MALTPEQQAELLRLGDEAYEASLAPDDGENPDPATVYMPNLRGGSVRVIVRE